MLDLWLWSSLGLFAHAQEETAPTFVEGASAAWPDSAELFEVFGSLVAEIRAARREGDLETARTALTAIFEEGIFHGLTALPPEEPVSDLVEARLVELAWSIEGLEELATEEVVWSAIHDRMVATRPPEDVGILSAKQNLGMMRYFMGDLEGALKLFEYVHEVYARTLPADNSAVLDAKQCMGQVCRALGDPQRALAFDQEVLAARERIFPEDHQELLAARFNVAVSYHDLGRVEESLELLESVHEARERTLPADSVSLLQTREVLAGVRGTLGDTEAAIAMLELVVEDLGRLVPPDHPELLNAQMKLATELSLGGDQQRAGELLEHVLAIREELLPPDHPDVLLTQLNLSGLYSRIGEAEKSLELAASVLAKWEHLLPSEHPDRLGAEFSVALGYDDAGNVERAREILEGTLETMQGVLRPTSPDRLKVEEWLVDLRRRTGDLDEAASLARSLLSHQLEVAAGLLDESPRAARMQSRRELRRLARTLCLSATVNDAALDRMVFEVIENLRAVSVSSGAVARAAATDAELTGLRNEVAAARYELEEVAAAVPDTEAATAWRQDLLTALNERDRLEKELQRALDERGLLQTLTVDDLAKGLEEDAALACFLRYWRIAEAEDGSKAPSVDSLLAFVLTPDASVRRVELGSAAELEGLALDWRESLGKPVTARTGELQRGIGGGTEESPELELASGRRLRERLLDALFDAVDEEAPSTLHVVLDDFLYLIPLDALPTSDGGRLGDTVSILPATAGSQILGTISSHEPGVLVAMGGIEFGAGEPAASREGASSAAPAFGSLPGTAQEVQTIGRLFAAKFDEEPEVLEGADASKAALTELAAEARFLHVATHGWFSSSSDESTNGNGEVSDQDVRSLTPEVLCGLALAGANDDEGRSGRRAGILRAEELSSIDLSNCELAVLSACETNVGIRSAGQGIQSLQSALHNAGARAAITSLWRVDDVATRRLMELFYSGLWTDGLAAGEALWRAKSTLREEGHPVRDWAGWVLTGSSPETR